MYLKYTLKKICNQIFGPRLGGLLILPFGIGNRISTHITLCQAVSMQVYTSSITYLKIVTVHKRPK